MSILIKGMEMPTHCMDCPFMVSRDNDDCILQSDEANENFENWEQMKAGCPLVPVPEFSDIGFDSDDAWKKIFTLVMLLLSDREKFDKLKDDMLADMEE